MSTGVRNVNNSGRRAHARRPLRVAVVGTAVLAVLGVMGYIAARSPDGVPLRDYQTVYAELRDPGNLQRHNEVRVAGVTVGQVVDIRSRDGRSLLELKLDPGTAPLPSDTTVYVRGKGLLGARYVELRPGSSPRALEEGAVVRGGRTALTYGVPDALETFDRETRGAFGEMLGQFGTGLLGRGRELNGALDVGHEGSYGSTVIADEILARPGAAQRLLPSVEQTAAAFDQAREELARSLPATARGLQPFVDRRDAVRAMLDEAPSTLTGAQSGLERGRRLLRAARHLSTAVSDTLPAAAPGLRLTTTMLREAPVPLRRTSALLRDLRPVVPDLLRITGRLSPNLVPLRRAFDDLDRFSTGVVPYACDIENFSENLRSVIGQTQGPGGPIGPLSGFRSVGIVGPEAMGPFASGSEEVEQLHRYEPYPEPCKYSPGDEYDGTGLPTRGRR